jgi:hypothetical protein
MGCGVNGHGRLGLLLYRLFYQASLSDLAGIHNILACINIQFKRLTAYPPCISAEPLRKSRAGFAQQKKLRISQEGERS